MNTQTALALCEKHVRHADVTYANEYGEPGYGPGIFDPEPGRAGILFADWNDCPKWLMSGLERRGFALEWSDEWIISYETGKAYRSSPDSHGWTPYFVLTEDGDVIGGDEIESGDQADWYVNEYLLNDPRRCNVFRGVDLTKFGFTKHNDDFENGWHPGQNDNPSDIFATLKDEFDVVFSIAEQSQFYTVFQAWVRPRDSAE